ncbi:hypothetical protein WA026_018169 [Henosepilachna vigintioctopunctata]|uniref:2-oxoisovalerate dehydrogenase subunit alpha n=1 Tax=Henosepilachna vigintioctopunctata TaxID=420089 RepID=A0AAW1UHJ5_9CUCU
MATGRCNCLKQLLLSDLRIKRGNIRGLSTGNKELNVFPGSRTKWTEDLKFTGSSSYEPIPVYRVMDQTGRIKDETHNPQLSKEIIQKMYRNMSFISVMDKILYESQRQGRISFYMTNTGEEASHIGSAAALNLSDIVYAQYREIGVLIWRGFTAQEITDQCYGNCDDLGQGKQMPVHYGSKKLNFVTISSPLGTQIPQAVGAAYALKGSNRVVICYFGDGAASEGDAHAAFNFAATLDCPVIFFCRNNGYAISTPVQEQYKGDGIAARGPAFGINTLRVDGNDVFAVYNATKYAKSYCLKENKPVLIEAMMYRVGHHSTSDDSTAYRSVDEIKSWSSDNPISKLRAYMEQNNLWNDEMEQKMLEDTKKNILKAFYTSEAKLKPKWSEMFGEVYSNIPQHLKRQMDEMKEHVAKYKNCYPVDKFSPE